jgi:hypothetical protein
MELDYVMSKFMATSLPLNPYRSYFTVLAMLTCYLYYRLGVFLAFAGQDDYQMMPIAVATDLWLSLLYLMFEVDM